MTSLDGHAPAAGDGPAAWSHRRGAGGMSEVAIPASDAGTRTVRELPQVMGMLQQVLSASRSEVLCCDDPSFAGTLVDQPRGYVELWHRLDAQLVARAVEIRQVMSVAGFRRDDEAAAVARLADTGVRTRLASVPLPRVVLVDRRVAILALDGCNLAEGAVLVREPATVRALAAAYEQLWAQAVPATSTGVPEQLAPVLTTLMAGVTDEVASRRIGISQRTYSRRVTELLGLLDVSTRFQAGAAAAERGWLHAPVTP